jgi:hypothetical protein
MAFLLIENGFPVTTVDSYVIGWNNVPSNVCVDIGDLTFEEAVGQWEQILQKTDPEAYLRYRTARLEVIRFRRNQLLTECDWTMLPDSPLTEVEKEIWRTYRQELRDLTNNITDLNNVVFPQSPINMFRTPNQG